MIHEFLTSEQITFAHLAKPVVEQSKVWYEAYKTFLDRYGDHWAMFKVYEPDSLLTAQSQWPVLSCAAWLHAIILCGKAGMENVFVNRTSLQYLLIIYKYMTVLGHTCHQFFCCKREDLLPIHITRCKYL